MLWGESKGLFNPALVNREPYWLLIFERVDSLDIGLQSGSAWKNTMPKQKDVSHRGVRLPGSFFMVVAWDGSNVMICKTTTTHPSLLMA